jgi:hypothetical protein
MIINLKLFVLQFNIPGLSGRAHESTLLITGSDFILP